MGQATFAELYYDAKKRATRLERFLERLERLVPLVENLSDPGLEDALYENLSVQRFVGLRLSDAIPDETTILNFRHRLEAAALGTGLLEEINRQLQAEGLQLRPQSGTIVDASIISAPSSTKNRAGARIPRCTRRARETSGTSG